MKPIIAATLALTCCAPCVFSQNEAKADNSQPGNLYHETYRPQFHFSPKRGWVGDPTGLVKTDDGLYHIYWWGHAISPDLVHFTEISPRSIVNVPDSISCFTGSVVIDKENRAGFGKDAWIAAYTTFNRNTLVQSQSIAPSADGGLTFEYMAPPVIDLNHTEFRDPTCFWHEPSQKFIFVVAKALDKKAEFYTSDDMRNWTLAGSFGPAGDSDRSWECPELIQVPLDGDPDNLRDLLIVSCNWDKVQYFVGDFDGKTFTPDPGTADLPRYIDLGLDTYATHAFHNYSSSEMQPTILSWVAKWDYAPAASKHYRSDMFSIPRNLSLVTIDSVATLVQTPVEAIKSLRGEAIDLSQTLPVGVTDLPRLASLNNQYELELTIPADKPELFGMNLCVGEGRKLSVTYDTENETLTIDRTNVADSKLPRFERVIGAKVPPVNGKLKLRVFVDKTSVEIFCNDGRQVFTALTYPSPGQTGVELTALRHPLPITLTAYPLASIWD